MNRSVVTLFMLVLGFTFSTKSFASSYDCHALDGNIEYDMGFDDPELKGGSYVLDIEQNRYSNLTRYGKGTVTKDSFDLKLYEGGDRFHEGEFSGLFKGQRISGKNWAVKFQPILVGDHGKLIKSPVKDLKCRAWR